MSVCCTDGNHRHHMSEARMQNVRKLLGFDDPLDDLISLHVQPIAGARHGVFANAVLIAIHPDQATADAHCQRLRSQQAEGLGPALEA